MKDNPYDFLEVDPRLDSAELTRELRRRIQRAPEKDRPKIQEAWESLTLLDAERVKLALMAHPRPSEADPSSIEALKSKLPPVVARLKTVPPTLTKLDLEPAPERLSILEFQPKLDFEQ